MSLVLCLLCLVSLRSRSAERQSGPTPSSRGDSQRPPTLTTTCVSRLEFPSAVALPQGGKNHWSHPQVCVSCLHGTWTCRCF